MSFNLKRVLFGKFCSLFAASLFTFVAGLTVLRETSSGFQFALVLLAGSVPRFCSHRLLVSSLIDGTGNESSS